MRYYTQTISGQNFNIPKRIFEFNPDHPVVKQLVKIHNENPEDPKINPVITQLFENCLLSEGDLPNPAAMVPRINQLIELLIAENSED
jgi:molecular chaperone HtpG